MPCWIAPRSAKRRGLREPAFKRVNRGKSVLGLSEAHTLLTKSRHGLKDCSNRRIPQISEVFRLSPPGECQVPINRINRKSPGTDRPQSHEQTYQSKSFDTSGAAIESDSKVSTCSGQFRRSFDTAPSWQLFQPNQPSLHNIKPFRQM